MLLVMLGVGTLLERSHEAAYIVLWAVMSMHSINAATLLLEQELVYAEQHGMLGDALPGTATLRYRYV